MVKNWLLKHFNLVTQEELHDLLTQQNHINKLLMREFNTLSHLSHFNIYVLTKTYKIEELHQYVAEYESLYGATPELKQTPTVH